MHENSEKEAMVKARQSLRNASKRDTDTGGIAGVATDDTGGVNACEFGKRILHLFSGPSERSDGLAAELAARGWSCDEYDIVNGPLQDLAADQVWEEVMKKIEDGLYQAMLAGPPCNTFTNARKENDNGPKPLRSAQGPERYGLKNLSIEQKEQVRFGNLMAVRTAAAVEAMDKQEKPSIVEQPLLKEDENSISMFKLDEYIRIRKKPTCRAVEVAQCRYGARTSKPTTLLLNRLRRATFHDKCNHDKKVWKRPSTGQTHWGAHPPLKGKEWYIPGEDWKPSMLRTPKQIAQAEKNKPYLTSGAQAYPHELNRALAKALIEEMETGEEKLTKIGQYKLVRKRKHQEEEEVTTRQRMRYTAELKGKKNLPEEDDQHLGGMRDPSRAMRRIPGYREAGVKTFQAIMKYLDNNPEVQARCIEAIGSEDPEAGPTTEDLAPLRQELNLLHEGGNVEVNMALDTQLQAGLLWRIGRAFHDPDADEIYEWLTAGAPAGIEVKVKDPGGIFPVNEDEDLEAVLQESDSSTHTNYSSVDSDETAGPEVQRLISTGFVYATKNLAEMEAMIGAKPKYSKLGMITKVNSEGRVKRRLILDCKESGINSLATKGGHLVLPRISDVIDDTLRLMKDAEPGQEVEWLVLDFTDWFFNIPLHPKERKYFTIKYKEWYICYLTQAQGSVNAPVVCGRVAAMVARITQATVGQHCMRMQLYVDDPCLSILGTEAQRSRIMAVVIVLWRSIGARLAFKKAVRGTNIVWIGAQLEMKHQNTKHALLRARAKQDIVDEVATMTNEHLNHNVIKKKALQSYVGKLNHVAGIIEVLRPFMSDLYGVLHKPTVTKAPKNCLWSKQWRHVSTWIRALLGRSQGVPLSREYRLMQYYGGGLDIRITTDASPWGIGGILTVQGQAIAYYHDQLTSQDVNILQIEVGSSKCQQVVEALATLVALRLWKTYWHRQGIQLQMRSDSVSTLSLLAKLRTRAHSHGMGIIARELALEFGDCSYKPRMLLHIPGIANDWADALSRRHQPDHPKPVPPGLRHSRAEVVPVRDEHFYLALTAAEQGTKMGP